MVSHIVEVRIIGKYFENWKKKEKGNRGIGITPNINNVTYNEKEMICLYRI